MTLRIVPVTLREANAFVERLHRHSKPVRGHKFAVAVAERRDIGDPRPGGAGYGMHMDCIVGVAIVGRPVAPALDDGRAVEVLRVCTDGTRNACSMLYGAARRAARAMGHEPVYTYTLPDEGGASLRGAGYRLDKDNAGGPAAHWHNRPGRSAQPVGDDLVGGKWRWVG